MQEERNVNINTNQKQFIQETLETITENVKIEIGNINFDPLFAYTNPTDAWNFLKELLVNVANTHAPFTTKTIKGKPCPWLNEGIKREMNYRDALNRTT